MEIFMTKNMKTMFLILIMIFMGSVAYAEEERSEQGDFLSSTLSDVFNSLGDYASGERDISKDYNDNESLIEYDDTGLTHGISSPSPRAKRNLPEDDSVADPTIKIHGSTSGK